VAVVRMSLITESGIRSVLKRRIERRVRRKAWRSVAVNVYRFNFVNDPLLSFAVFPRFIVIFERELVNMFVGALRGVFGNLAANLNISIRRFGVLNDERNFGTRFHVAVFCAALVGVNENVVIIRIEPYRCDLR
jgi:hypothetical protein